MQFEQLKQRKNYKRQKKDGMMTLKSQPRESEHPNTTKHDGELTLTERTKFAKKVEDAHKKKDYANMPIEYLREGGDIFTKICRHFFPNSNPQNHYLNQI
jgi:hypothetical protein